MTDKVGIFRSGDVLANAVEELQKLLDRSRNIRVDYKALGANPELVSAYRTRLMLKLALTVAYGALQRTESRGAHFREDYPQRNDAQWLNRTIAIWDDEDNTFPTLDYESLDVMSMELPPGWRGYGEKNHISHPDSEKGQQQIEQTRQSPRPSRP